MTYKRSSSHKGAALCNFCGKKLQRTVGRSGLGFRFSCTMIGYISNENRKISL